MAEEDDDCQEFPACHAVLLFRFAQNLAGVGDHSFCPIIARLGEYRTYPRGAGIGVNSKWQGEV